MLKSACVDFVCQVEIGLAPSAMPVELLLLGTCCVVGNLVNIV